MTRPLSFYIRQAMVGPSQESRMISKSSSMVVAAAVLAVVQVATPAKAETWSFFPWYSPSQPEKPRVTGRLEQPAAAPVVAPAPAFTPPPVRTTRVAPAPVQPRVMATRGVEPPASTHIFSRPYMVVGLGI